MNCFVSQETLWNFQQHWNCKIMGTFKIDMPRWSTRAECYDLNVNVLCHRLRYLNSWSRNGSWLGELWSLQEAEQTESNQSLRDTLRFIFWPWFWCPPPDYITSRCPLHHGTTCHLTFLHQDGMLLLQSQAKTKSYDIAIGYLVAIRKISNTIPLSDK